MNQKIYGDQDADFFCANLDANEIAQAGFLGDLPVNSTNLSVFKLKTNISILQC